MSDSNKSAPAGRLALVFIFITMFVDSIGFGIVIPVTPKLIAHLTGDGMSGAAVWGGWLYFIYALMQFVCAPLIGNLSDRFGRRPVLIASLLSLGIDYLITGLAPTIAWLFLGRFLSGIAGASYTTVNAYIADVSPPGKRAANFGLVGAAFSMGFIVGPAIGGVLGQFGPRVPFLVAAGLAASNAAFGFFVLKESLAKENRRGFDIWRANPVGALKSMSRFPLILPLCAVIVLMRLAHDANPSVFAYYTMLKFHWSTAMVGYALMAIGAMMAVIYSWLIRIIIPRIGEANAVYLGLSLAAIGFTGYALSTQGWMIFVWMLPGAFVGFAQPALNAIMSRMVGPTEQGELMGALTCVGGLTSVIAPPLLTGLFAWFTGPSAPIYFPGAAFIAAALFLLAAMVLFARLQRAPVLAPAEQVQEG